MNCESNNNDDNGTRLSHAERRWLRRSRETEASSSSDQTSRDLPEKVYADDGESSGDCPVCLMPYLYPTVLPCGHMFCYLCIKGIMRASTTDGTNSVCPMCRKRIPKSTIIKPTLYEPLKKPSEESSTEYKWFYQRRQKSGWWRYDDVTCEALENAYKNNEKSITIVITGQNCHIDLSHMTQITSSKKYFRRIKRDLATASCVGVAGIFHRRSDSSRKRKLIPITEDYFIQKVYKARKLN